MNRRMEQTRRAVLLTQALYSAAALTVLATSATAQPDLKRGMGAEKDKAANAQKQAEFEAARAGRVLTFNNRMMGGANGAFNEQRLRADLQAQGVTDEATLTAILEHVARLQKARQALDEKSEALRANLKPNTVVADAQMNVLINDYQAATEDYKTAREQSARQLDEKIGYSKRPRLHAVLLTLGVVGDGPQSGNLNRNDFGVIERLNAAGGPLIMRWNDANGGNGVLNFQHHFEGNAPDIFAAPAPGFPNADIIVNNALRAVQPPLAMGANPGFGAPAFGNMAPGQAFGQPFGAFNRAQAEALKGDLEALKVQVKELNEEMKRLKAAQEKAPEKKE